MITWTGMNRNTGRTISSTEHIKQSVADILTTPVGTRVMRRDYGIDIFPLLDQPQNDALNLRLMASIVHALTVWEPRIRIVRVSLNAPQMNGQRMADVTWQHIETGQVEQAATPVGAGQ